MICLRYDLWNPLPQVAAGDVSKSLQNHMQTVIFLLLQVSHCCPKAIAPESKIAKSNEENPRRKVQTERSNHGPGNRRGAGAASGCWARSSLRGGGASSLVMAPSHGMDSRDAALACIAAWVRETVHRAMRVVMVACRRWGGVARGFVWARDRKK